MHPQSTQIINCCPIDLKSIKVHFGRKQKTKVSFNNHHHPPPPKKIKAVPGKSVNFCVHTNFGIINENKNVQCFIEGQLWINKFFARFHIGYIFI